MSTRPDDFRSEDAFLDVAKDLQKLTISESIKNAGQRRELATVTPAGEQNKWIWGCSSVLLWLCRAVCQDGHITAGDTRDITALFCGRSHESANWQWACRDAVESFWLLETQLLRPQLNPETVSPWEKERSSSRYTILSWLFFSPYLFTGSESTFILLLFFPPLLRTLPDPQRQKTGTAFWSSWFISTACTGSQWRKEERKDCKQPRNVPRCMLLAGQAIAF